MSSEASSYCKSGNTSSKVHQVKDDWEDSDEEEQNEEIWNNANSKPPPPPMPTIVTTNQAVGLPHPGAFEPKMKILKRQPQKESSASNADRATSTPSPSFQDREASYQAARARIFAQEEGKSGSGEKALSVKGATKADEEKASSQPEGVSLDT